MTDCCSSCQATLQSRGMHGSRLSCFINKTVWHLYHCGSRSMKMISRSMILLIELCYAAMHKHVVLQKCTFSSGMAGGGRGGRLAWRGKGGIGMEGEGWGRHGGGYLCLLLSIVSPRRGSDLSNRADLVRQKRWGGEIEKNRIRSRQKALIRVATDKFMCCHTISE
jgi:hypothetical protein